MSLVIGLFDPNREIPSVALSCAGLLHILMFSAILSAVVWVLVLGWFLLLYAAVSAFEISLVGRAWEFVTLKFLKSIIG